MSIITARQHAYLQQNGRCWYCRLPMWQMNAKVFTATYGVTKGQAYWLQATAEHLKPRSAGGKADRSNIVAACRHCNQTRHEAKHPLEPEVYRARVERRIKRGAWQPNGLCRLAADRLPPTSSHSRS